MPVKNYSATISEKEKVAHNSYRVRFAIPEGETIEFQPGQFITILVANNARRSYSIASSPVHTDYVETFADTVAGGPGSQFFENCKVGDSVSFLGALGKFVYQENSRPVFFYCTNTGVTPFVSMITYALETLKTQRIIQLKLGFRHEEDIFTEQIFKDLAARFPNFSYEICLSQPAESWQGFKGRVTATIEDITSSDIDVYICGSQAMINDVESAFLAKGVPESQIFYEQFY